MASPGHQQGQGRYHQQGQAEATQPEVTGLQAEHGVSAQAVHRPGGRLDQRVDSPVPQQGGQQREVEKGRHGDPTRPHGGQAGQTSQAAG